MAKDSANVEPQLLAFLICQDIMLEAEVVSLWRVIDSFHFSLTVPASVSDEARDSFSVQLQCRVFTRWGSPGEGEFEEQLGLVTPDGKEVTRTEPKHFKMSGSFRFNQTNWEIQLGLQTEGLYHWVLYLNGSEKARLPFRVNIDRQSTPAK